MKSSFFCHNSPGRFLVFAQAPQPITDSTQQVIPNRANESAAAAEALRDLHFIRRLPV
jgi:hypothetical protein